MYIYIISGSPHGLADQALQDGAYVDARDDQGWTALVWCGATEKQRGAR